MLTAAATSGLAVQTALPLSDVDEALADLRTALLIVSVCGIVLAALLAPVIAKGLLRPVVALTDAAERVSRTRNLKENIDTRTSGELGRLSRAFDRMLRALEASADAQRRLVADASHELRTPLASLHMNIELLAEGAHRLPKEDRQRLINDLAEQVHELGTLTTDLIDLAHQEDVSSQLEELRLDTLVGEVVNRRRRHAPAQRFEVKPEPCVVRGVAQQLARAVTNLLDNAVKWNPANEPIDVRVSDGTALVRDHGPGIAESDLPHVFERFDRSTRAAACPDRASGSRSCTTSQRLTAARSTRRTPPTGERCCRSRSLSSPEASDTHKSMASQARRIRGARATRYPLRTRVPAPATGSWRGITRSLTRRTAGAFCA